MKLTGDFPLLFIRNFSGILLALGSILWLAGATDFVCSEVKYEVDTDANFNADRAFNYLEKQCDFGARYPGSKAHEETKNYLVGELKKFADEVEMQSFTHRRLEMANILGRFGSGRGQPLLLAAHWDTRPFADKDRNQKNRNKPIIGANDGASGVAVLLELARVMSIESPPREVIIVLFDGEDYGKTASEMFLGSKYFAKHQGKWKAEIGILIDMVGDKNLEIPIENYSWKAAPELINELWLQAENLGLSEIFPRKFGPAILDDHLPLINAGIPTIDLIDFDYPHWHTLGDTPDKCSPESLEAVGILLKDFIFR